MIVSMKDIRRACDVLSEDKRKECIQEITSFFKDERDEDIGIIAAENLLNHFLQIVGFDLYNKGIDDAKNFLKIRFEDAEIDMDALLKK